MSERRMTDASLLARLGGLPILRMNGIGNAIVVLDLRRSTMVVTGDEARAIAATPRLCFDQLMVLHDPEQPGADAFMRIYNTDGSLSGACGNGSRCAAWYMLRGTGRDRVILTTSNATLDCHKIDDAHFSVDMGVPSFRWDEIPLQDARLDQRAVDLGAAAPPFGNPFALGIGNPHAVFFVPDADAVDLRRFGPPVETAPQFPERANVSFAQVVDRGTIKLRVWERGAGVTLGCGSGACAALVAAASTGRTGRNARVILPGGALDIEWRADDHVVMTGPVELEFETVLGADMIDERAA